MKRFKSILAVLTEDSLDDVAFDRAVHLARSNDAALTLVDVIDSNPGDTGAHADRAVRLPRDRDRRGCAGLSSRTARQVSRETARAAGVEVSEAVLQGAPFVEVIRMVLREGHDIVIKGATAAPHGRGVLKGFDMHLLRKCPCPVWMLMGPGDGSFDTILAAVDPEPTGDPRAANSTGWCSTSRQALRNATARRCTWPTPGICRKKQALRHGRYTSGRQDEVDRLVEREREGATKRGEKPGGRLSAGGQGQRHLLKGEPGT
jgi:universal stress protein E